MLGAPYAANLQSFPWIPTRFLLFLFPPETAYAPGVAIAALLSALFTYLFCRRAGLSDVASASAGWTFACAGFFASRVMAGHLPLLEAYPALPPSALAGRPSARPHPLRAPPLGFDMARGGLHLRGGGRPSAGPHLCDRHRSAVRDLARPGMVRVQLAAAMAFGGAMALAAWWPMFLLIQKSTRILDLDAPDNDVVFPYRRILALFAPGIDGWPAGFGRKPFSGYPNASYLFDTASYIGLAPIVAAAALLAMWCIRKRRPDGRFLFLAAVGGRGFPRSASAVRVHAPSHARRHSS
ncbi:MAG: hypothetical protein WDO73_18710 [Ignavibacteriota bacterium]